MKVVPCEVSSRYGTWVWRLEFGPAQCISVTLFKLPLCPALPEGQKLVLFWQLACPLMTLDGPNSISSYFPNPFGAFRRPGQGFLCWLRGGIAFVLSRRVCYVFLSYWSILSLLITKSATPFGVSVFSLNIALPCMSKSILILVNKFIFFDC